jgi:hypothetical protein
MPRPTAIPSIKSTRKRSRAARPTAPRLSNSSPTPTSASLTWCCSGASTASAARGRCPRYGVGYKSYTEQYLDSTGIFKEAVISILAIVAKQERVRLSERTRAGIERAKSKGTKLGKPGLVQEQIEQIRRLKGGGMSNYAISNSMGISATTVAKYLL